MSYHFEGVNFSSYTTLLKSFNVSSFPFYIFSKTKLHIEAIKAAVAELSAPPDNGKKKPLAPDLLK